MKKPSLAKATSETLSAEDKAMDESVINQVRYWLRHTVVGLNFCPFAKRPLENERVRYAVVKSAKKAAVLEALLDECRYLESHDDIDTSLLILDRGYGDFHQYLDVLDMAQELLALEDYEGIFQLASFHPEYCFDGADMDDPANYTNRAPYPIFHIIREQQLEDVLASYDKPEEIPQRNILLAREKGVDYLKALLERARDQ